MKNVFAAVLATSAAFALALFFGLIGKEEVKGDQRVNQAIKAVQDQQFDDDFSTAWNGLPTDKEDRAKLLQHRNERLADLKATADRAIAKRDHLDSIMDESLNDMEEAINEAGADMAVKKSKPTTAEVPNPIE
jgi:hypothetical protein